jgi:hypothetical protein
MTAYFRAFFRTAAKQPTVARWPHDSMFCDYLVRFNSQRRAVDFDQPVQDQFTGAPVTHRR